MEMAVLAEWQSHHIAIFSLFGIRFDAHFLLWASFLCWFAWWCKSKSERLVALTLLGFQVLYVFAAFGLDVIDHLEASRRALQDFVLTIKETEERVYGIGLDATIYAAIDYLTILALIRMRPRRMVDPITFLLIVLIMVHLVVATIPLSGAFFAYDIIWMVLYYLVFIVLFVTSGKVEQKIGHICFFDICHLLARPDSAKVVYKK